SGANAKRDSSDLRIRMTTTGQRKETTLESVTRYLQSAAVYRKRCALKQLLRRKNNYSGESIAIFIACHPKPKRTLLGWHRENADIAGSEEQLNAAGVT